MIKFDQVFFTFLIWSASIVVCLVQLNLRKERVSKIKNVNYAAVVYIIVRDFECDIQKISHAVIGVTQRYIIE